MATGALLRGVTDLGVEPVSFAHPVWLITGVAVLGIIAGYLLALRRTRRRHVAVREPGAAGERSHREAAQPICATLPVGRASWSDMVLLIGGDGRADREHRQGAAEPGRQ